MKLTLARRGRSIGDCPVWRDDSGIKYLINDLTEL